MGHDTTKVSDEHKESKLSPDRHNEKGEEVLDPYPVQPPLGYTKTLSLHEQIAQQVRLAKFQIHEADQLEETEDEADDFEVGDDFEPLSPHENDHVPTIKALKKRAIEINEAIKNKERALAIKEHEEKKRKEKLAPTAPLETERTTPEE